MAFFVLCEILHLYIRFNVLYLGLTRSSIYAGGFSVIVSLCSVYDPSTKELMLEFYKQLKNGKDKDCITASSNKDNGKEGILTSILLGSVYFGGGLRVKRKL